MGLFPESRTYVPRLLYKATMLSLTFLLLLVTPSFGDVVTTLQAEPKASTLVQLVVKAGLVDALKAGTFTIFAPTDDAFAKLPDSLLAQLLTNNTLLAEVLKDHVVQGSVESKEIYNELKVPALTGNMIRFNIYAQNAIVTANGAKISQADVMASNGVIHYLDNIIVPATKTVVQIVLEDPELSTLLSAMTAAQVSFEFQADNFTLFAPTNAAFAALNPADLQLLLANPDKLEEVVEYHGIAQTLYSAGLYNREVENTIDSNNDPVRITVNNGGVMVGQGRVIAADIQAKNGVIHKIDRVLIPRSIQQWLASNNVGK